MSFEREQRQVANTIKRSGSQLTAKVYKGVPDRASGAITLELVAELYCTYTLTSVADRKNLGLPLNSKTYLISVINTDDQVFNEFLTVMEDPSTVLELPRIGSPIQSTACQVISTGDTPMMARYLTGE